MFDWNKERKAFEKLKFEGCEEAMSRENADIYIKTSEQYFQKRAAGDNSDETDPKILKTIKDGFYDFCQKLRRDEVYLGFLRSSEKAARFYRYRGQMLGIDTGFIDEHMSPEEIFDGWLDAYWKKVEVPIKNPALADYMFASRLKDSPIFFGFLLGAGGYLALETAHRYGFDPIGVFRWTPDHDVIALWTYRDEGYLYTKWRDDRFFQEVTRRAKDGSLLARNILALGAGGMPELRRTDYYKRELWKAQHFVACDSDPRIDFDFLMENCPAPQEARSRIYYHHLSVSDMLAELANSGQKFDLIYTKGVISFMTGALKPLLQASMDLLNDGGRFMFDMQCSHFVMQRDALIFGWGGGVSTSRIELMEHNVAAQFAFDAAKSIGIEKDAFDPLDPCVEPYNHEVYGINFIVNKGTKKTI